MFLKDKYGKKRKLQAAKVFLMALGLSCMQIFGQESIKKDTIKLGAGLKKDVGGLLC